MIDPAKLTAENGFMEGCVVEIVDEDDIVVEYFYRENVDVDSYRGNDFRYDFRCESLRMRPLTGPMAIWNFAPERSDILLTSGQDLYRFFTNEEWNKWKWIMLDDKHDIVTTRPFWAGGEK